MVGSVCASVAQFLLDRCTCGQCGPPLAPFPIKVLGVYYAHPTPSQPSLSGKPGIIEPTLAHEIDRSVRQGGSHKDRNRLDDGPKLSLAEPDSLFRTQAVSHINYRTYEFPEIPRRTERRVAYHVDIPGLTVRVNDSVIHLEVRLVADGFLETFPGRGLIGGMNALEKSFESRWRFSRVES